MSLVFPIHPIPERALRRVDPGAFTLFDLMCLAVVEHGAPMTFDEIRVRLAGIGVHRPLISLRRAWGGRAPLRKTLQGKLEIVPELDAYRWWVLWDSVTCHLEPARRRVPPPLTVPPIDQDSPISVDELRLAYDEGMPDAISRLREASLLLEAFGPMTAGAVVAAWRSIAGGAEEVAGAESALRRAVTDRRLPAVADAHGRLRVDSTAATVRKARAIVRRIASSLAESRRSDLEYRWRREHREARERDELEERRAAWAMTSKRYLRCLFDGEGLAFACTLDPDTRVFHECDTLEELRVALSSASCLIGLDPRTDLERCDIDARAFEIVDLTPPLKRMRAGPDARLLRITPELAMRGTLRNARPLGDCAKLLVELRAGRRDKVRRRLFADLKSLDRFHDYGCRHHYVRLRHVRGFGPRAGLEAIDEILPVRWNDALRVVTIREVLAEARERGRPIEIVAGRPPQWADPWARRIRVEVVEFDYQTPILRVTNRRWPQPVDLADIYAARPAI